MSERKEVSDGFCAAWVLQLVTDESTRASSESIKANIDEQVRQTAEAEWDRLHSDEVAGMFSINPYQKRGDYADQKRAQLAEAAFRWKAIQNFVTRRICACIDEKKEG